MDNLSDDELIKELSKRLQFKDKAYHDMVAMTKKLETLNARLLESEKVKSHFLSNIRNEINNPLTSVLTMCEILLSEGGAQDLETLRSIVSIIYKEAFNLSFQMRNIFTAADLESGEATLSISTVDVDALIRGTIDSYRHKTVEKKIRISCTLNEEMKENRLFSTDPEKLQCIISNLMSNSIEYSTEGKAVEVKAWRDASFLNISIIDQGIGIDEKDQEVIFQRFKQLDTGVTKNHSGHGLGLSVTRAALELLNGKIVVVSRKGEGAIFTISVPEARTETSVFSSDGNSFFFDGEGEKF